MIIRSIPPATVARWVSIPSGTPGHRRQLSFDKSLDLSRPVYRYMQVEYLAQVFNSQQMFLSPVTSWPDPYEQWWHSRLFGGGAPLAGARAFASCWTWRCRDEPFWRLYDKRCDHRDANGNRLPKGPPPVRIKSTVQKIIDCLSASLSPAEAKIFLAPVGYTTTGELHRHAASLKLEPAEVAREAAHALTFKRRGFSYEREVRVLWIDRSTDESFRQLPIDAGMLVDEVMVGPVPEAEKQRAKLAVQQVRDAGFTGILKRSLLYQPPL